MLNGMINEAAQVIQAATHSSFAFAFRKIRNKRASITSELKFEDVSCLGVANKFHAITRISMAGHEAFLIVLSAINGACPLSVYSKSILFEMLLKKWLHLIDDEWSIPCGKIMVADFHTCKSNAYPVVPNAAHRIFFLLGLEVSSLDVLPFHINHSIQHLFEVSSALCSSNGFC